LTCTTLRWRLTTSFPKTLDTLYGACEMFSKAIADLSGQKFQISVFGPGEIVPAFQVFDAVANNTVEMGNSASYYYIGKDLAFAFGTAVPFGLNTRQMNAWLAYGGGRVEFAGASEAQTHLGWTLGGGVEVGLTPNWSARAEYLYVRLDDRSYVLTGVNNGFSSNVFRLGVNYRF